MLSLFSPPTPVAIITTVFQTMAVSQADTLLEQDNQRKQVDGSLSIVLFCSILRFIDASPMVLFGTSDSASYESDLSTEVFESFVFSILSANDAIRQLAGHVATRLFFGLHLLDMLRSKGNLISETFKRILWSRRLVC